MATPTKLYPRTGDRQTIYLNNVITDPNIQVGDYTMYNDFVNDPAKFQQNNVLYHYPVNQDNLLLVSSALLPVARNFYLTARTIRLSLRHI